MKFEKYVSRPKSNIYLALLCLIAVSGIFLCGCGERDDFISKKLDIILASDLKAITADLPAEGILSKPFYTIVSYKSYKEGIYSQMAIVDFYCFKNVKVKIVRKYRYLTSARLWDRYFNEYIFYGDTVKATPR
jgi:hypothetical protein